MRIWAAELAQSSSVPIDRRARPEYSLVGVDLRAYGGYEKRRRERKVSAGERRSSRTRRPRAAERACGARGTDGTRSEDRWRRARGPAGTGPSTPKTRSRRGGQRARPGRARARPAPPEPVARLFWSIGTAAGPWRRPRRSRSPSGTQVEASKAECPRALRQGSGSRNSAGPPSRRG